MRSAPDPDRLHEHVRALAGERHRLITPEALRRAEDYVARSLGELGLEIERPAFLFRGDRYRNVVGREPGRERGAGRLLLGAHFDSVPGSPGADDNASGIAALLEAARLLAGEGLRRTVEFVGFNLEEPQAGVQNHRVGSRAYARAAAEAGVDYAGCLVFEMVGYTDPRPRSQGAPWLLFWKDVPRDGTFLAAVGNWKAGRTLGAVRSGAARAAPGLRVVTHRTPFRGWLLPVTRLSDHARFWDRGWPAVMLTDTAFLRNPHYHSASDRPETLDYGFMARVVATAVEAVRLLDGEEASDG